MRGVLDEGFVFRVYEAAYMKNNRRQEFQEEKKTVSQIDKRVDFSELFNEQLGRLRNATIK